MSSPAATALGQAAAAVKGGALSALQGIQGFVADGVARLVRGGDDEGGDGAQADGAHVNVSVRAPKHDTRAVQALLLLSRALKELDGLPPHYCVSPTVRKRVREHIVPVTVQVSAAYRVAAVCEG